jgi:hypothetical protein
MDLECLGAVFSIWDAFDVFNDFVAMEDTVGVFLLFSNVVTPGGHKFGGHTGLGNLVNRAALQGDKVVQAGSAGNTSDPLVGIRAGKFEVHVLAFGVKLLAFLSCASKCHFVVTVDVNTPWVFILSTKLREDSVDGNG